MKKLQPKISALVITYNEVTHIDELIKHLNFVDEIIVIDAFSTDYTFEKLKTYPQVKTIQYKFLNFSDQRNFAIKQANENCILFIDADERIKPKLKDSFLEAVKNTTNTVAYEFPRKFVFQKKIMRFSGLQTDKVFRLFKKGTIPNAYHFYIRPTYKFINNYVLRLGLLDGNAGYIICKLNAYGVWYRYHELKRLTALPEL